MDQQKGFSLIEVLLSFMLTTTVVFFLLELYGTGHLFLNQVLMRTHASTILDSVDEALISGADSKTLLTDPYTLHLVQNREHSKIELYRANQIPLLTRDYLRIKAW